MTLPAAPSHPVPGLVDLAAAREQWVRKRRRGNLLAAVPWVGLVALNVGNAFTVFGGGTKGAVAAVLNIAFYVAFWSMLMWWERVKDRREEGPASTGTSSVGTVRSHAAGPDVWSAVLATAHANGYGGQHLLDPYTVELSKWSSWRPRIFLTVRAVPHGDSGGVVTVWARADGWERAKARRLANTVLTAIPGATPLH